MALILKSLVSQSFETLESVLGKSGWTAGRPPWTASSPGWTNSSPGWTAGSPRVDKQILELREKNYTENSRMLKQNDL